MKRSTRLASVAAGIVAALLLFGVVPLLVPLEAQTNGAAVATSAISHDSPDRFPPIQTTGAVKVSGITTSGQPDGVPDIRYDQTYTWLADLQGTTAIATADSKVEAITKAADGTFTIALTSRSGQSMEYSHLREVAVKAGDQVSYGQLMGKPAVSPDNPKLCLLGYKILALERWYQSYDG